MGTFLHISINELETYFLRARFNDLCPFPIGVAKGPFSPTPCLWTESIAACGMWKFPSGPLTGVTSTGSQSIGTCKRRGTYESASIIN